MNRKQLTYPHERTLLVAAFVGILMTACAFSLAYLLGWPLTESKVKIFTLPLGLGVLLLVVAMIEAFCRLTLGDKHETHSKRQMR